MTGQPLQSERQQLDAVGRAYFERLGIRLPDYLITDGTKHSIECSGNSYTYYSGQDDGATDYIMVDLVGGDSIMDSWCWHLGERGAARRAAWDEQAKSVAANPVVQREIRRYRALRASGWRKPGESDAAYRERWLAAGAEAPLRVVPPLPKPATPPPAQKKTDLRSPTLASVIVKGSPLDWGALATRGEPPARRWAIKGWLGFGHVTILVGAGGIGKTLIGQQAGSCLALGGPAFIDEIPSPLPTLMWCCEDDHDELWRRQVKIARWQNVPLDEFSGSLIVEPRVGLDNALVVSEFGRMIFTPLLEELREQAGDYRAEVVILDNVAQLYGANENDRHAVTMFLNALVGALPGRAILLLAHPSRGTGSEFSGSSAWENCARTRLYLGDKLPDMNADETDLADDVRYLARRKANYSTRDYRRLTFSDGVLIPDPVEAGGGIVDHLRREKAVRVVVAAVARLHGRGVRTTDGSTSPHFLPKQVLAYKLGEGCTKRELADAMRRAVLDGKLTRGVVGKYENRAPMHGLMVAE